MIFPRLIAVALVLAACYIIKMIIYVIGLIRLDSKLRSNRKAEGERLKQTIEGPQEVRARSSEDCLLETFYCGQCYRFSQIGAACEWCQAERPEHPIFLTLSLEEHNRQVQFPPVIQRSKT